MHKLLAMEIEEKNFDEFDLSSLDDMMTNFAELQQEEEETEKTEEVNENDDSVEESTEETEDIEKDNNTEVPSSHDTKDSPLTPYAKMLVEEGLLPNIDLEKFDGSVDSLLEAQRQYDVDRFESYKESSLDPRVKWLQNNLEQGVPLRSLLELEEQKFTLENVNEETLGENENLQKDIIKRYYQETTNFKEDKINKLIERLETLGELEEESKTNFTDLKTIIAQKEEYEREQAKTQSLQAQEQKQKAMEQFQQTLDTVQEIIPGVKVSSLLKDKIKQTLTTPVGTDPYTGAPINKIAKARMEDPINFEIKLAYLFEVTKGLTNWEALSSSGKKKAMAEFEESIKSIDLAKGGYKNQADSQKVSSYIDEMEKISRQI